MKKSMLVTNDGPIATMKVTKWRITATPIMEPWILNFPLALYTNAANTKINAII